MFNSHIFPFCGFSSITDLKKVPEKDDRICEFFNKTPLYQDIVSIIVNYCQLEIRGHDNWMTYSIFDEEVLNLIQRDKYTLDHHFITMRTDRNDYYSNIYNFHLVKRLNDRSLMCSKVIKRVHKDFDRSDNGGYFHFIYQGSTQDGLYKRIQIGSGSLTCNCHTFFSSLFEEVTCITSGDKIIICNRETITSKDIRVHTKNQSVFIKLKRSMTNHGVIHITVKELQDSKLVYLKIKREIDVDVDIRHKVEDKTFIKLPFKSDFTDLSRVPSPIMRRRHSVN